MHILLSSEETLYQVSTHAFSAKGRAEQISAELFYPTKKTLLKKQAQEQAGYITTAAQAAYASLNKLDWTKTFYAYVELTPNTQESINFDGNSSGLGYALALALEWRKQINKTIDYNVEVFATGEIHSSGAVTEIGHLETKITAACSFMEKKNAATQVIETQVQKPFVIFYPISNQEDVTPELEQRVEALSGQLCPVERLQTALTTLLGNAYDGDAEGRWEPFKGLLSFNYEDSLRFFGRERALKKLSKEFNEAEGLLVCTGVSGSGKSSLIKAGLIPQINKELPEGNTLDWLISTPKGHNSVESILFELLKTLNKHWSIVSPTSDDKHDEIDLLANTAIQSPDTFIATIQQAQLTQPNKCVMYYVDQFEELFYHQEINREQAQQLAPLLAQMAKQIPNLDIVISIRSEYEDILGKYGSVSHVNPELNASEWGDIVYKQATSFGLRYEPELEKRIVNEASSIQHALPALEYLLEQLYKKAKEANKNTRLLTHDHYEQLKGIKGVIASRAEEVIAKHPMQAHAFFEYFVGLNNENKPYAKSVNTDDAKQDSEALYGLIQVFIDAQLVVDCSTETEKRVKLAHDTLLNFDNHDSAWTALKEWFEENQAYLQWLNVISGDFKRWSALSPSNESSNADSKNNQSRAFLLNEHDLNLGLAFQQENCIQQPNIREYIAQSQRQKEALLKQKNKKQRLVILLVSVFCMIAVGAGFIAYKKEQEAKSSAIIAKQQELIAKSETAKSKKALIEGNHNYAIALNEKAITSNQGGNSLHAKLYSILKLAYQDPQKKLKHNVFEQNFNSTSLITEIPSVHHCDVIPDSISISHKGEYVAIVCGNDIRVWDIKTGKFKVLAGHTDSVKSIDFSPSGMFLVSGSSDHTVLLWDILTGESELLTSEVNRKVKANVPLKMQSFIGIRSVAFSPDGKGIAAGLNNGNVIYYDIESKNKTIYSENNERIEQVLFTFDSTQIIYTSEDNTLRSFNILNHSSRILLDNSSKGFADISLSKNGNYIAYVDGDHSAWLWDKNTGVSKALTKEKVNRILFTNNDESLVMGRTNGELIVFNIHNQTKENVSAHFNYIWDMALSKDEQLLATVSSDRVIKLWNTKNWQNINKTSNHSSNIRATNFSANSESLFVATDNMIRRYDLLLNTSQLIFKYPKRPKFQKAREISFSKKNKHVAIVYLELGGDFEAIHIYNLSTQELKVFNQKPKRPSRFIFKDLDWSNNGEMIATLDEYNGITVWDIESGNHFGFPLSSSKYTKRLKKIKFIKNDLSLLTLSYDGVFAEWDISSKSSKVLAKGCDDKFSIWGPEAKEFSPSGDVIICSSVDGDANIINLTNEKKINLKGNGRLIRDIAISGSEKLVAAASTDNSIKIHDLSNGNFNVLSGFRFPIKEVKFSPDSKILMTLSGNHIKLWNVWEKSSARLVGHSSQINSIEFSEDGESLLSSSNDETVKLWDLATGQSKTFYGHSHYVTEALFKGNEILSSSFDKTVRKWSIESGESQILETFKGGMLGGINSLAYSSENDLIAASSFLRTTFINPSTKEVLEFKNKAPSRLKFSKNGTILVSSSMKNIITLRDTNFKEITSFALNTNRINDISISKGGDCFISGADDGKVLSINGQSGEATLITKQVGKVNSVDCSSNGTLVASGGVSRSLIISNLVTGNSEEFTGFSAEITSVVFSKDGRKIATGLANGNILILDIEHLKQPSTYWHSLSNEYRDKTKVFLKDLGIHTTEFTPNLYGVARSKVRELNDHPLYLREGKNKNELMKLGIIAQKDNDWDKARRLYRQAKTMGHGKADSRLRLLSLMEKEHYRVKRLISPEVLKPEELLFNRANMLKKEGDIQLQLNKLDKALSAYALSKQGLENLIKETPKKVELADLLSDLYLKEGDIKTRKNNKIQAKKSYEATIEILERFSWAFPENTVLMERLANSYNKAERIYFQLGELEEFLIFGEKVKAFIGSQLLIYPENTFLLKAQCSTYRSLANYYLRFNLENDALVSLKRCETSYEKVAKLSPSDVSVKSTLFYYYQEISVLYAKQKSNKFAEEYLWSKIKYFGIDELSSNKIELISRVSEIYMYWSWWALSNKNTIARIPYILGRAKGFISPSTDRYIVIQTNLAHALILTGKYDQAKKVYSKYKAYMFESGNSWDSVILKDFEDLRGYGVTHPDFSRIAKEVFNTEI